jgi:hypothetical protein
MSKGWVLKNVPGNPDGLTRRREIAKRRELTWMDRIDRMGIG